MSNFVNKAFKVGYLNLRAQTGFGTTKQAQVEHFVKQHIFDILHLQEEEAQILEDFRKLWFYNQQLHYFNQQCS